MPRIPKPSDVTPPTKTLLTIVLEVDADNTDALGIASEVCASANQHIGADLVSAVIVGPRGRWVVRGEL